VVFNYFLYKQVTNLTVDIFSLSGKTVAELAGPSSALASGWNRISWDVKDRAGVPLTNGLYVYVMRVKKGSAEEVLKRQFMVRR
jgi:flagellar hook assembly protein FlgD